MAGHAQERQAETTAGRRLYNATLMVFAGLLVVIVVAATLDWMLHPQHLPVRNVRFEGEFRHVTQAELSAVIRDTVRGNFLLLDLDAMRRKVEQLPWVYRADVRRLWPSDVSVQFEEQKVIARWGAEAWVNHAGDIVRLPGAEFPADMPELHGPKGTSAQVLEQYQQLAPTLGAYGLVPRRLVLTARRTWEVDLANGIRLVLDRNDTQMKVERFADVYTRNLAPRAASIQIADLRYGNGFAIRWHAGAGETGR